MTIEYFQDQLECRDAFTLDNNEVIVVADGKNSCLSISRQLIDKGVDIAHFFAQRRESGMVMIRFGKDTKDEGKSNDYSEQCRKHEVECILRQQHHSKVKFVVIPCGHGSDVAERLLMARSLKESDRAIPIIFEGNGLSADVDDGVVVSLSESVRKSIERSTFLKCGDSGVVLNEYIDAYTQSLHIENLMDVLRKISKASQR